jgi:hypothetical protein
MPNQSINPMPTGTGYFCVAAALRATATAELSYRFQGFVGALISMVSLSI